MQRQDPTIDRWRRAVLDQVIPTAIFQKDDMTMRRQFKSLFMRRSILFRKVQDQDGDIEQLVIPRGYKDEVLNGLHYLVGHPRVELTTRLLRVRFYWPEMSNDVENWVKRCDRCLKRKDKNVERAPIVSVHTTYQLELVL